MAKSRTSRRLRPPVRAALRKKPRPALKAPSDTEIFEQALLDADHKDRYVLRLYVTGTTPRSAAAISNIRRLCEEYLKGHYDLEVIDIYQQPVLARGEQIIAAPTLIKKLPAPLRKMVGNLSNEAQVLMGLDIRRGNGSANGGTP